MNYLIVAPPRVGNHVLTSIIQSTRSEVNVTHDSNIITDYKNTHLLLLNRRKQFLALMSQMIWNRTGHSSHYPADYELPPFEVAEKEFIEVYKFNNYHWQCTLQRKEPWIGTTIFYYEDFVNNPHHVFTTLNIQPKTPIIHSKKSPYKYQDVIVNVEQCKQWYRQLKDYDYPIAA
jgi:hypothetical protein